ncbi:alpha/beta hydrolase domain-containing protein [Antribacter gilvus]|uniref:alpha/beta hydrolase domain-containing protein n=1 Tax=Antribacter gilvus TaxID=2304675 RepID=UPI0019819733|nr:alpha/beta hydrolase domain-containing protein [Antribacter gilvus]
MLHLRPPAVPSAVRRRLAAGLGIALAASLLAAAPAASTPAASTPAAVTPARAASASTHDTPIVVGPLPGTAPGDPLSPDLADTYPFFSTDDDLAAAGYVEEEFVLSGRADAWAPDGTRLTQDVPYSTRIVVRRPAKPRHSNGVVLMEWQNVTAGYDLDALWNTEQLTRDGYTWVGVSAQRVGVEHLRRWSPARYGALDVTGGGAFSADELSYEIFADAARAVDGRAVPAVPAETVLAIGASQSAGRMVVYYDRILPQTDPVFDGYAFVVGNAPTRAGDEPVFHLQSETDVRLFPSTRPDDAGYRRWEVAGAAHSGWAGQEYRRSISERDLGGATEYTCTAPPFSRVPMHHVTTRAYGHLAAWVDGVEPPHAPPIEMSGGQVVRDGLGHAVGGIRLSQVSVPTSVDTGVNSGASFCLLFGSHRPLTAEELDSRYRNHGAYVARVARAGAANVTAGFVDPRDALADTVAAARSDVGG